MLGIMVNFMVMVLELGFRIMNINDAGMLRSLS